MESVGEEYLNCRCLEHAVGRFPPEDKTLQGFSQVPEQIACPKSGESSWMRE